MHLEKEPVKTREQIYVQTHKVMKARAVRSKSEEGHLTAV